MTKPDESDEVNFTNIGKNFLFVLTCHYKFNCTHESLIEFKSAARFQQALYQICGNQYTWGAISLLQTLNREANREIAIGNSNITNLNLV